jgi:flavin reductase (DIM6/NTAB) family NADH-FMN oxidoreductase RutF
MSGELLRLAEYGCYLLSCGAREEVNAMPLSLFMQASFKPPVVMVGVAPERHTHKMIRQANIFAVIFLRKDQKQLIDRFKLASADKQDKFKGLKWERGVTGAPVLEDCLGYVECRVRDRVSYGDHDLFAGEVVMEKLVSPGPVLTQADLGKVYTGK